MNQKKLNPKSSAPYPSRDDMNGKLINNSYQSICRRGVSIKWRSRDVEGLNIDEITNAEPVAPFAEASPARIQAGGAIATD